MVTQEQRKQVSQARESITRARQEAKRASESLQQVKKALPSAVSQQALRQQMPGLKGRETRRKIGSAREEIKRKEEAVKDFERDVSKFEKSVASAESIIREEEAIKTAQRLASSGRPIAPEFIEDPLVRSAFEKIQEQRSLTAEFFTRATKTNKDILSERLETLKEKGLTEDVALKKLGFKLEKIDDLKADISRSDDRTFRKRFDLGNINPDILAPVSGKSVLNMSETPVRDGNIVRNVGDISGDSRGFIGSLRSRVSNFIGSGDDFKKDRQEAVKKITGETFIPSIGVFGKVSAVGEKGTLELRAPTIDEQVGITRAQDRGSLENINRLANTFVTPSGVRSLFNLAAEKTIDLGGKTENILKRTGKIRPDSFLDRPSPISRETSREVISSAFMFGAFSPLMEAGVAAKGQKTKQVQKKKTKKEKITKKDLLDALRTPKIEGDKQILIGKGSGNFQTKAERARGLLRSATSPEGRTEAVKIIREAYGDDFLRDFAAQEGISIAPRVISRTKPTDTGVFEVPSPPLIGRGKLTTTETVLSEQLNEPKEKDILSIKSRVLTSTAQDTKTAQDTQTAQLSVTAQKSELDFAPKQTTTQQFGKTLTTLTATAQQLSQKTSTTQQFGRPQPKKKPASPRFRPTTILGSQLPSPRERIKKVLQEGFIPQVKDKGSWKNVTKKPRSKKQALAIAAYVVDNSTAAQLRLKKSNKPPVKPKVERRINIQKFRDFKKVGNRRVRLANNGLIEKKKARIDTTGEKAQLSAAKLIKSKSFRPFLETRNQKSTNRISIL